jgi:UDP-2,3-diacylglucosamine hydrolase
MMKNGSALFISDLHLDKTRPDTTAAFFHFAEGAARNACALYILGDLFEFWVGDDQIDHDPLARRVTDVLAALSAEGVAVCLMRGNRDFLIGERFAREAKLTLLDDPSEIGIGTERYLLLHGDTLCTDDVAYQRFRTMARDPAWQAAVLAKPYAERVALAHSIREKSATEKAAKPEDIMDVSLATVEDTFRQHDYLPMIHGHTHRPALHTHVVDGHTCSRRVLADWHATAEVFAVHADDHNAPTHSLHT